MSVVAVTMVKDEADIVEVSVSRMLAQVDGVVVADNGSTDGTWEILQKLPVKLVADDEVAYYQSDKMSRLAAQAEEALGAEWIVPFDCDEVWIAKDRSRRVADVLAGCDKTIATAEVFNHYCTAEDLWGNPIERMTWRTSGPLGLPKVACRPSVPVKIAQGNHTAGYPSTVADGLLEIRHFPYRSPEQFVSKARNGARAYAATNLDPEVGKHWRDYGELIDKRGEDAAKDWFRQHFFYEDPSTADLIHDPCP